MSFGNKLLPIKFNDFKMWKSETFRSRKSQIVKCVKVGPKVKMTEQNFCIATKHINFMIDWYHYLTL